MWASSAVCVGPSLQVAPWTLTLILKVLRLKSTFRCDQAARTIAGMNVRRPYSFATALGILPVLLVALATPAQAVVTVSRAEVSGDRLRLEGQAAPNRPITVDGVSMTTSSSSGSFRIDRTGYLPPNDCTVDLNDGTVTATNVALSGCVVSTPPAPAALGSLKLSPTSVAGGTAASATVTLTAPAPSGGAVVTLSSSNPAVVSVPASVTILAGASSAVVSVSTTPVTSTVSSVVSATYNGATQSATITVTPPASQSSATLDSIVLDPSTVQTGRLSTSATLYFTTLTPAGGAVVTLSSSDTTIATVPTQVTVPANSSTGAFGVAVKSGAVGSATISATYAGVTRTALLTVTSQTLLQITTDAQLPHATVGQNYAGFIVACCGQGGPYTWSLVSGTVPDGLKFAANDLRLTQSTAVTGVAKRPQTTTFTVRVKDTAGNTAKKTFTLTVDPASPTA